MSESIFVVFGRYAIFIMLSENKIDALYNYRSMQFGAYDLLKNLNLCVLLACESEVINTYS